MGEELRYLYMITRMAGKERYAAAIGTIVTEIEGGEIPIDEARFLLGLKMTEWVGLKDKAGKAPFVVFYSGRLGDFCGQVDSSDGLRSQDGKVFLPIRMLKKF